jgi:hypothetical protein
MKGSVDVFFKEQSLFLLLGGVDGNLLSFETMRERIEEAFSGLD